LSANEPLKLYGWDADLEQASQARLSESTEPARVAAADRGRVLLFTRSGERRGVARGGLVPATGDWVIIERGGTDELAPIVAVLPRRSKLSRKVAGKRAVEQTLAANVDTVFVVVAADGDVNERRIERYLSLAWAGGARPVVILTKVDLSDDPAGASEVAARVAVGVPVHAVSGVTGEGLSALQPYLSEGSTIAMVGSSGVGKSTLINALCGDEIQTVKELGWYGKGQHTTTRRELVRAPNGVLLVDTPGLREVGLWDVEEGLAAAFSDIDELARECRFSDCNHTGEPGCAVVGGVPDDRLASYHKLQREARSVSLRADKAAQRRHQRQIGRWMKRDAY
jgi:ribosome biogenesis GTPase